MTLRNQALKGGFIMVIRQGLGILLSLIGVILITRVIGASQYGLFGASAGIIIFLYRLGTLGLDVYLVRKTTTPEPKEYNQVFTILLGVSTILVIAIILGQQIIANALKLPDIAPILVLLSFSIPLNLLNIPFMIKLDRDLNFQRVALIELVSQISFYLAAIPLAFQGAGAWSPAIGLLTQQGCMLALTFYSSNLRLRLCWRKTLVKEMFAYGISYSSSTWIWELRTLVNPVIVGRFAGAEAVAFVTLCIRLVEMLAFAKGVTWRLAMAALAKLDNDRKRLRESINEGMRLQALAVGIPMAAFSLVAPVFLTIVFGEKWSPVLTIFPFIAVSYLSNSVFNLHSSVLYILGKNVEMAAFHFVHVLLFIGSAILLVPKMGMIGYAWSEIVALVSYLVIHFYTEKEVGSLKYRGFIIWYSICIAVIFIGMSNIPYHYFSSLLLLIPLVSQEERKNLMGYFHILKSGN
jgi:O-antigen/teichoic acid export membrane protein